MTKTHILIAHLQRTCRWTPTHDTYHHRRLGGNKQGGALSSGPPRGSITRGRPVPIFPHTLIHNKSKAHPLPGRTAAGGAGTPIYPPLGWVTALNSTPPSSVQKHTNPTDLFHFCRLDHQGPPRSCSFQRNPKCGAGTSSRPRMPKKGPWTGGVSWGCSSVRDVMGSGKALGPKISPLCVRKSLPTL